MLGFQNNHRESDLPLFCLAGKCMTPDWLHGEAVLNGFPLRKAILTLLHNPISALVLGIMSISVFIV